MQNWYCLVHFPDGTQRVELIPGPAPVPTSDGSRAIIKITGHPGTWRVRDVSARVSNQDYAAEIWVERYEPVA